MFETPTREMMILYVFLMLGAAMSALTILFYFNKRLAKDYTVDNKRCKKSKTI